LDLGDDAVEMGGDGGVFYGAGIKRQTHRQQIEKREIAETTSDPGEEQKSDRRQRQVKPGSLGLRLLQAEEEGPSLVLEADDAGANRVVAILQVFVPGVGGKESRDEVRQRVIGEGEDEEKEREEREESRLDDPEDEEEERDDAEENGRVERLFPVDDALHLDEDFLPIFQQFAHPRHFRLSLLRQRSSVSGHD